MQVSAGGGLTKMHTAASHKKVQTPLHTCSDAPAMTSVGHEIALMSASGSLHFRLVIS